MSKDKEITKSWIEKRIHEKAVERYENEIDQAYNQLKDSILGELSLENPPEGFPNDPLKFTNKSYYDSGEGEYKSIFQSIFKDYTKFRNKKIAKYEQEETDALLNSIKGNSVYLDEH